MKFTTEQSKQMKGDYKPPIATENIAQIEPIVGNKLSLKKKSILRLSKGDITPVESNVTVALDFSVSMKKKYADGTMQKFLIKMLPLFDKLHCPVIDAYLFNEDFKKLKQLSYLNVETYVREIIGKSGYKFGATRFGPIIKEIIKSGDKGELERRAEATYRGEDEGEVIKSTKPRLIIIVTDGDISDGAYVKSVIDKNVRQKASPYFYIFLSLGKEEDFKFSKELSEKYINVDFVYSEDINMEDEGHLRDRLLYNYLEWANDFKKKL